MVKAARTNTQPRSSIQIILQSIILLPVLFISLWCLKNAAIKQLEVTRSDYLDVTSAWLTNPDVLADMAEREYLTGAPLKARTLYIRALDSFVLHFPSWLGLAEVLNAQNKTGQAAAVLQTLEDFTVEKPAYLWRMTQLARKLNQDTILISSLRLLLVKDPNQETKIFNIAGTYWQDPQSLLENFNSRYYPQILDYYIREDRLAAVRQVWEAMQSGGQIPDKSVIDYTAFLLRNKSFDRAVKTWRTTFQNGGSLLYNGNFEEPIINNSFGWRATDAESVSLQYEETGGGLTIEFAGTENTAFMLSQIVPLYPGDHIFRGYFETTGLTSTERPYFLISGYNCQGLYIQDTMLPASEYKTEFAIPFHLPDGCKAAKINLIRQKANPFDSLISGTVTLTDLQINRLSPLPANLIAEEISEPRLSAQQPKTAIQKPESPRETRSVETKPATELKLPAEKPQVSKTKTAAEAKTSAGKPQITDIKSKTKKDPPNATKITQNQPAPADTTPNVYQPNDIKPKTTITINRIIIRE